MKILYAHSCSQVIGIRRQTLSKDYYFDQLKYGRSLMLTNVSQTDRSGQTNRQTAGRLQRGWQTTLITVSHTHTHIQRGQEGLSYKGRQTKQMCILPLCLDMCVCWFHKAFLPAPTLVTHSAGLHACRKFRIEAG